MGSTLALGGTLTTASAVTVGDSGSTGTVSLAGNNSFSAGLNVTFGMLTAASNTALGTGNVTLAAGTTLTLNAGIKLSNQSASTLTLANATTGLVNLAGTGVQDTVAALVVNGVAQLPGTYGAAGSGATFALPDFRGRANCWSSPSRERGRCWA